MKWFDSFVELSPLVRPPNPTNPLVKHRRVEVAVFRPEEAVNDPYARVGGSPFR